MYQIFPEYVKRIEDGKTFGFTPGDPDFDEYMVWINEGNHPLPRDSDTPQQTAKYEISSKEAQTMLPRAVREFMLLYLESAFTPDQLARNPGYVKVKAFDTEIAALRAQTR